MQSIDNDPELASEIISLLTRELKSVKAQLQAQASSASGPIPECRVHSHVEEIKAWKERALEAEQSLLALSEAYDKQVQDLKEIQASEMQDTTSTEEEIVSLTTALEKQRAKNKEGKLARKELLLANETLQKEITHLQSHNTTLANDVTHAQPLITWDIAPRQEIIESHLSSLPHILTRPPKEELLPVCRRSVNLEAFLALDPTLRTRLGEFLFLPGRFIWCNELTSHAFGVSPSFVYNITSSRRHWERNSAFPSLWGKKVHLFYTNDSHVYYAGLYEALDLRSKGAENIRGLPRRVSLDAMADAAISSAMDEINQGMKRHIETLLIDTVLTVDILGLQCISFDTELYETLHRRFAAVQPARNPKLARESGDADSGKNHPHKRRRA